MIGYMCATDYEYHSEKDLYGIRIYPSVKALKEAVTCVSDNPIMGSDGVEVGRCRCGIVKVEFKMIEEIQSEETEWFD